MPFIGQNIPHDSAPLHVTGQSLFLDDLPPLHNELLAAILPSPYAHANLRSLDLSASRAIPGLVAILTAADVHHNTFGPVVKDEHLLVEHECVFLGQPLAILAATSYDALHKALRAAKFEMDELPPLFTIDDALAANSFLSPERKIQRGDPTTITAPHTLQGALEIAGQEHFYLESQIALAIPGEQAQMTIHSSTQHPSEVQMLVAEALNVPFNHVTCICKRMGGGFGGKETQAAQPALFAALLARHTHRPVRFAYSKDDDMRFTGKRHPFKALYDCGFDDQGKILSLDVQLYSNGGCSTDLSNAVLERAMLHLDNAYYLPHVRITGRVCKTHLPSNTAFRGFGGPQGVAVIENLLTAIAAHLHKDPYDVRELNCYGTALPPSPGTPGEGRGEGRAEYTNTITTPYGQLIRNNTLPELFSTLRAESHYDQRRADISHFNATSKTHLKGLGISAVKFGISFTRKTMNQANALVNIYQDGSVLVSTGATEMGQGVNTRIRQIVADELGIPYDSVLMSPTSTDKNNNTSPTAASAGTDLNGSAAADACRRLRERLAAVAAHMLAHPTEGLPPDPTHIRFENGHVYDDRLTGNDSTELVEVWQLSTGDSLSFQQVVCQAYEQRLPLGERGHYATPNIDFNRETGQGSPFLYFTNGVALSEVLIDRFTGQHHTTRVDLLMDLGQSINPGIDRGQITGGFIQGMGWCTTEQLVYNPKGQLLSHSPTTYKIPNISDTPEVFNIRFLPNPGNDVSLYRSKAVGEPPLLLGLSVWLAIKDALHTTTPAPTATNLPLPATAERILLAIESAEPQSRSDGTPV